jgi:hypothetical protein
LRPGEIGLEGRSMEIRGEGTMKTLSPSIWPGQPPRRLRPCCRRDRLQLGVHSLLPTNWSTTAEWLCSAERRTSSHVTAPSSPHLRDDPLPMLLGLAEQRPSFQWTDMKEGGELWRRRSSQPWKRRTDSSRTASSSSRDCGEGETDRGHAI